MFQKQTFGSTNTGFGSFNANASTSSPFSGFKPTTGTSAFGAPPAFGANATPQPAAGGGLFGSTTTTGGLFGSTAPSTGFGAATGGFGFGAAPAAGGGLFGNNTSAGLFANNQNQPKPAAGFGFGGTSSAGTTGGLFGSAPSTSTGLFGQQNTTLGGGGLFGNTAGGFGQQQATGTAHAKYSPVVGTDVVVKSGSSQNVNIKHHCITCMKEYEGKSLEELRLEDYAAGRKGSVTAGGGMFGGSFQQPEAKPLFGGSTFGQPATTSAPSLFGSNIGSTPGFGQTNTFSFGNNTQANTNTTGLFGANKPAFGATATTGTGLFGATTTQAPTFGTNTSTFGFGANTQAQPGGLFGAKPATTGFGATPASSSGFGAFGGGGLFGAKPQQTTAPTFGSTAPAFGAPTGGFGTNTTGSGLFGGGGAFGKPATTQPSFGFTAQPALGTGLGTGLGTSFQAKPAQQPFSLGGGTSLFSQPAQNNTFRTGLDSGLGGGGMFGNTSALGGTSLGLGQMNANNTSFTGGGLGGSAGGNVHEQILNLAARPYGDTPLFKDLLPDTSTTAEDVLKPTNPAAVKAVLDGSASFRASPPTSRLKLTPKPVATDKKSLFDGLEESDASLEDKLSLKPSRKRLVLRPNHRGDEHDSLDRSNTQNNRSIEEPARREINGAQDTPKDIVQELRSNEEYSIRDIQGRDENDNHNLESSTDRHGNWLGSTKHSWRENEKPIDGEPTPRMYPRLYPDLDKELPAQVSERRASWLTTKPLRKPLVSNPDMVENSVRELGVRERSGAEDKENIDSLSVSEEENVPTRDAPPHPAGVKLTRPGYYTIPTLEEMTTYMRPDGSCVVPHLTIGRKNYGNVFYDCEIDVAGMDLDTLVHFLNKEVIIYPDDENKPPVGSGLNRRAVVTLERVWPRDKTEKRPLTEPDRLLKMDYEGKLRRVCDKHDTKFIEYRPQTGSWVFRVEHFSKYGLTDSDEEDDITPDVLKRQLVNQSLQKSAAPVQKPPVVPPPASTAPGLGLGGLGGLASLSGLSGLSGLGGLGGLGGMGLSGSSGLAPSEELYAMQQTSLNLMGGAAKVFDMDTTEDGEPPSLYQDNRAFGVKSPTSELARLEQRQSHHVQLMKASLYNDTEMEDDVSLSTGDQLVPQTGSIITMASRPVVTDTHTDIAEDVAPVHSDHTEEIIMRPLIVHPQTIVLKYHKKVPPFKQTIAGRLHAAHLADMSVCRARHSRVGFGPAARVVYASTHDSITRLPHNADLCDLGKYTMGRTEDDWSEPVVARLALGQTESQVIQETLSRQLESLLQFSTSATDPTRPDTCPRLIVKDTPTDRRELLRRLLEDASKAKEYSSSFGVSSEYCLQVWRLCEALWGADLDNDGVAGTDVQSRVSRHLKLLQWLKECVADTTDKELAQICQGEPEDETDGHSARVWTLLIGGRILEACKVARDNGDLNMATLIAQATGDPSFRSLIARQLHVWRECGAEPLVGGHRRAALHLLAGLRPRGRLEPLDWPRALNATARYLCPQIPNLEQIIRAYEAHFTDTDGTLGEMDADLSTLPDDEMGMQYPTPPYLDQYNVTSKNGKSKRALDLRYELLRARALNTRARLSPAGYTPDPFDHSLSFLLGAWLDTPPLGSITGMADQLASRGDWHLAVQALAYHPDDTARGHLIRDVLSRHVPSRADTPELKSRLQLLAKLNVPQKWVLVAQAARAKYEHKPALEVECLVGAEQWNAAHRVLLDELLPDAVLSDNVQNIKGILDKMNAAAERHEVSGWENGGQALYYYLRVCDEIRGLVSAAEADGETAGGVPARLEALRPTLAAACRALKGLRPGTPRHAAARSEMGARLIQLAVAGGEPPAHLAALLRALRLPPDCAARAASKIITDLADQASEMCLESAPSSPLSSHQRTTNVAS